MTLLNIPQILALIVMFACAGVAAAQTGPVTTDDSTSSNPTQGIATLHLNFSTGAFGATVIRKDAKGRFAINLHGLGFGSGQHANVSVTAEKTGAFYSTPINLTTVSVSPAIVVSRSASARVNGNFVRSFIPQNEVAAVKTAPVIYTITLSVL